MNNKARIIWDDKIKAFVDTATGHLVAPRIDEDGIDYFFVDNPSCEDAEARYCSGERYWAFPWNDEEIQKIIEKYKPLIEHIKRIDTEEIRKLLGDDE